MQRYDRRGYPENLASRLLSRQFRRAQNDILASVGVCVDERATGSSVPTQFARKHPSGEKSKIKLIRRENETGLSIAAADLGLFCLTNVFILGLRHRMQVSYIVQVLVKCHSEAIRLFVSIPAYLLSRSSRLSGSTLAFGNSSLLARPLLFYIWLSICPRHT